MSTSPTTPPPASGKPTRGATWLPWVILIAGAGLLVLRWMGMLGPC